MNKIPNDQRWLKFSVACRYASMSDKKLMRYIKSGDIYGTKRNGQWIVDRLSIDDFYLTEIKRVNAIVQDILHGRK